MQIELKGTVPNVAIEREIPGVGRADILYYNNDVVEVYEIKPGSYAPNAINYLKGKDQLNRYIIGLGMNGEEPIPGTTLNPIINATLLPSVIHTDQMKKYYTYKSDPGMIYWQYMNKPKGSPIKLYCLILYHKKPRKRQEKWQLV